jgi:hypothetical protein
MKRRLSASLPILVCATALAQTPPPPAAPATRLQQMEGIYQKELSSRHIPLLGKYLVELQRQAAAATDKTPYQAEIARVQQIISSGGVVDLIAAQQPQSGAVPVPLPPAPPPAPTGRKQALLSLSPASAQSLVPAAAPDSTTAAVAEAEWRIELLDAGTYDVLLHFSCPDLTAPLPLRVEFGGQTVEKTLETDRATKDAQTFRILRLGSLTLTGDHRGETLRLVAGDKNSPKLILKNLLITKPRPAN